MKNSDVVGGGKGKMAEKVNATILFVDIMDSMEIGNYWDTKKYDDFLNEFQDVIQRGI